MKQPAKAALLPLTLLLGASLIFGGCSAAKKPATPTPGTPATPMTPAAPKAMTPTGNTDRQIADRVAAEAKKVKDVQGATAVVSGKNIYLGLDLSPNVEQARRAEIEKTVMDRVKNMESGYTVSITSDTDIVTRIKNVASGIAQGKSVSTFNRELKEISDRMKPKTT